MTDKDLEKLIEDMAETYAEENQEYYFDSEEEEITTYADLRAGFIGGFKASMNFKEEKKMKINAIDYYKRKIEEITARKEYFDSIMIVHKDKSGNYSSKDLQWLFNEYPKQSYYFAQARDDVKFAEDGTPLHILTLYIDEVE